MSTKNIVRCRYKNKAILLPNGQVIESPCCKSPHCKRCCWYRKWKLLQDAPHKHILPNCYQAYMVLPYYKPVPKEVKKSINNFFWRGMRKNFGPLAYIHSLEQQHGLLHGNWHVLSDKRVEKVFVFSRWRDALARHSIEFKDAHGYCDPVIEPQKVTEYVVKYYQGDPGDYLPERGRYRKVMYSSPNYNEYVMARTADTLVAKMLEEDQP